MGIFAGTLRLLATKAVEWLSGQTVAPDSDDLIVAAAEGTLTYTVTDYTLGAGCYFTMDLDGDLTYLIEGTDFTMATSNDASATSLASAIDGISGVSASAVGAVVTYSRDARYTKALLEDSYEGSVPGYPGTHGGTDGVVKLGHDLHLGGGMIWQNADENIGIRMRSADLYGAYAVEIEADGNIMQEITDHSVGIGNPTTAATLDMRHANGRVRGIDGSPLWLGTVGTNPNSLDDGDAIAGDNFGVEGNLYLNGRALSDGVPLLDSRGNYTIYVDAVSGDDDDDGSVGSPIQTIAEAAKRASASLMGSAITVQLAAGSYPIPDLSATDERTVFASLTGGLMIQGVYETDETFTAASTTGNTITASGSPGWTTNEHAGRVVRVGGLPLLILSNTADTLTLGSTPTSMGGQFTLPGSGTVSIDSYATSIEPAATNPGSNTLYTSGGVTFRDLLFDGTTGGMTTIGLVALQGSGARLIGCRFLSWAYCVQSLAGADVFASLCSFDTCLYAVQANDSWWQFGGDTVFSGCIASGIYAYGGRTIAASYGSTFAINVPELYTLRNFANLLDFNVQVWIDTVTTFCELGAHCHYEREISGLMLWAGTSQPSKVFYAFESHSQISLRDSTTATLSGSTCYLDLAGTQYTLADYAATGYSLQDSRWNQVYG